MSDQVLFRPLWEGAITALTEIMVSGYHADKVIQRQLQTNRKWGSRDRKLFAELVYDVVRWWRRVLAVANVPWPASDTWRDNTDREALMRVVEAWCTMRGVQLDSALERRPLFAAEALKKAWDDPSLPRAVRQSVPNDLDAYGFEAIGSHWDELMTSLNREAPVFLRANRLRTTPQDLKAAFAEENIAAHLAGEDGLRLDQRTNVFLSKQFATGQFEVQDLHSQMVAPFLKIISGQRVVDACAGAGGKSLHLAALMKNKGRIVALDVNEQKLKELRDRSTRAGATTIETRLIEGQKTIKRLHDSADRVLLDVPCSGLGVLRRNPDRKWHWRRSDMDNLTALQAQILTVNAPMCVRHGMMVYATCSVMPAENELQIEKFLLQNEKTWKLEEHQTLLPSVDGGDGFYMARLKRL